MKSQAFDELPALLELIQQEIARTLPRQAFVTHIKEGRARVQVGDENPYTWYPLIITGAQVGSQVAMLPTPDGGYLLLPVDPGAENQSLALGYGAIAAGLQAAALGFHAKATGERALAVGRFAEANQERSTAVGTGAQATAIQATALGAYSSASDVAAMAMGYNAVADQAFLTEIAGTTLRVLARNSDHVAIALPSRFQLADATGTLHTLGMHATDGLTYDGNPLYTKPQLDALLAAAKPKSQRGVQNLNSTRTTAGDIDFTSVSAPLAAFILGLQPNTAYQVTVDMFISMSTASTGSFRPVLKFPTGGTEQLSGFTPPLTTAINVHPWKWSGQVTSNANGEISAMPSARWVSGSITSSRAELVLRVEPA